MLRLGTSLQHRNPPPTDAMTLDTDVKLKVAETWAKKRNEKGHFDGLLRYVWR